MEVRETSSIIELLGGSCLVGCFSLCCPLRPSSFPIPSSRHHLFLLGPSRWAGIGAVVCKLPIQRPCLPPPRPHIPIVAPSPVTDPNSRRADHGVTFILQIVVAVVVVVVEYLNFFRSIFNYHGYKPRGSEEKANTLRKHEVVKPPIERTMNIQGFERLLAHRLKIELGDEKVRKLFEEAVYFISIGSNDYMGGYLLNPHMRDAYSPDDFVEMVVSNLTHSIQELYDKGARKFGFINLCPLGCIPAFRAANPKADGGCLEDVSALALTHNNAFSAALVSLNYILEGFKYANTNVYNWLDERIRHPSKYGFKDGVNACCGTGEYRGIYSCGGNKEVSEYEVCETPEDHVWWDSVHATERLHEQIAKAIWNDPGSALGPYSLEELFFSQEKPRIADTVDDQQEGMGEFRVIL